MSNNKYKILVVEDDRNILSMIQTVLDLGGYQVLTAQRCQQGILMLTSHMPDLVVLDLGVAGHGWRGVHPGCPPQQHDSHHCAVRPVR